MTGRTHAIVSGICGAAVAAKLDVSPICVLSCIVGGLFPDTDCRRSILGRCLPLWFIFKPHRRNITHSFMGLLVFSILLSWIPLHAIFFAIGYATHLGLDMLNRSGIPLWWPNKHCVTIASVKVGGIGESFIAFLICIIIISVLSWW